MSTQPARDEEQFTVPVPYSAPTVALPQATAPAEGAPPVPPNPYAGQPVWPEATAGVRGPRGDAEPDPLLDRIGTGLFWVAVGWWVFVLVRLLGYLVRNGADGMMLIRVIDLGAEETIIAAVLSVLAALVLLFGSGRPRGALAYASAALAVLTVGVAIWRLIP